MEYKFTEKGHRYEALVDGVWKKMTGCTTMLNRVIAKPQLIPWSAKMAVEHFKKNKKRLDNEFDTVCDEAKVAHRKKKEEAGEKGTNVHEIIEKIIKEAIRNDSIVSIPKEFEENKQVKHFIDWALENKVKFLESEKILCSEKMFMGGTVDFVCEIDDQIFIGDIKTGKDIYADAFFQIAGYHIMLEEMGLYKNVTGYVVLNLRKDGTFKEARSISNDENKKAFLNYYEIDKITQKLNNNIIQTRKFIKQ